MASITAPLVIGGLAAAGGVASSVIGSNAAKSAAGTQAAAAANASNEQLQAAQLAANTQLDIYGQTKSTLAPFVSTGQNAMSQLAQLLGLPTGNVFQGPPGSPTASQIMQPLYNAFGVNNGGVGSPSSLAAIAQMPGYQFNMQQGQQALERSAAARGLSLSGGQLKDLNTFAQGQATAGFGNYVQQYLAGVVNPWQQNVLSPLQGLQSLGENAGAMVGNAGTATGSSVANTITSGANNAAQTQLAGASAAASGIIGSNNAITSGLQGALNNSLYAYQLGQTPVSGLDTLGVTPEVFGSNVGGWFSDRRLKTDIRQIGETKSGLPVYTYRFKGSPRTEMGVMAQDVEKKYPALVSELNGVKRVNYRGLSALEHLREAA